MAFEQRIVRSRHVGPSDVASPTDFELARGPRVELAAIYACSAIARKTSPYALDFVHREVLFVQTDTDIDLALADPFFHEAQRRHATRIVTASFEEVLRTASAMGESDMRFAWLYSAGRSGTTIAGRIAGALPLVQSLAEPDIFTNASIARGRPDLVTPLELISVLGASARLLAAHREAVDPSRPVIFVKHRGMSTFAARLFRDAVPGSRALFLHRHPADVVDSYVGAYLEHPVARFGRSWGLDRLFMRAVRMIIPYTHPWIPLSIPALFAKSAGGERALGAVEALACVLHSMRLEFARLRSSGDARLTGILRYEDLKSDGTRFARRLAKGLDLRVANADVVNAMRATHEDPQAGTPIVPRKRPSLSPGDVARVESTLARLESGMQSLPMEAV